MKSKRTYSDIYDINKRTGALILGSNRLDDYASKFLTKYCKDALLKPMPIPIDKLISKMNLEIYEETLSADLDIFGCCLLLDGTVKIFDNSNNIYINKRYKEGTILIDPNVMSLYGEGFKRNTIVHEIIHWEKDRTYFKILQLKNKNVEEKFYPIMCKQSEMFYVPAEGSKTKESEIRWLEWQAHRLAPRILMPKNTFKSMALEIITQTGEYLNCDLLVQKLSDFFIVSRSSVKYRLIEVGLEEEISKFHDYNNVYSEINNNKEHIKIEPYEAIKMIEENPSLLSWIKEKELIYVEGYFVQANTKLVNQKGRKLYLTEMFKRNLNKYSVNIREQNDISYENYYKDYLGFALLRRTKGKDKRLVTFHPKFQTEFKHDLKEVYQSFVNKVTSYDESEEKELMKILGNPEKTLCNALWFLMENRGWKYPEIFNEKTELHRNYHGKIKNDNYNNMSTATLMAICVGLNLSLRLTEKLFKKSNNKLNYYEDPDKTYIRIMEIMPGLDIVNFNEILKELNIKELGSEIKHF